MKKPALTYRQFSVQGATPTGLVVMLYDGAIVAMHRAAAAIEADNVSEKCTQLNRALAIIAQLEGTLNFELGGEVARTLKCLYVYTRAQLLKANVENSAVALNSVIEKLSAVRDAWHQAGQCPASSTATEESPGRKKPPSDPDPERGSWGVAA